MIVSQDVNQPNYNLNFLSDVINTLPYPLLVFAQDGTLVHANRTFLTLNNIPNAELMVGKYNILKDKDIVERGLQTHVERAFSGETTVAKDILVPLDRIAPRLWGEDERLDPIVEDIMMYPIFDDHQSIQYVVSIMTDRREYTFKTEVQKWLDYMEEQWLEPFSIGRLTQFARLSRTHFCRLFQKFVGKSPHDYYIELKIRHIEKALTDESISISQAFAVCGVEYCGHYAKVFRKVSGVTPSQYRKRVVK